MKKGYIITPAICGIFLFTFAFAQNQTKTEEKNVPDQKVIEQMKKAMDSFTYALDNARFTCPRYLLRWGMELYRAGAKEDAIKIAEATKKNIELDEKNISKYKTILDTRYQEEFKDPQLKQKMLGYLKIMMQVADEYIKYFKSGDEKIIDSIDKYFNDASSYNKEIEAMLKEPIASGTVAISNARVMCPRWFSSWSESYNGNVSEALAEERGYVKDIVVCEDCNDIVNQAKAINDVFQKECMNIQDAKLKEKYLAYIKAVNNMCDAYIELYKTGDKKLVETPYKYQQEAMQIEKEIIEYPSLMRQEKKQ